MDATPRPGETFARWVDRVQDGLSDNALADQLGTSATMVGKYKRGVLPKLEAIRRFSRWSKVPEDRIERMVQGERMARVMIQCPRTGRAVFTGIAMNAASFESSTLLRNTLRCPACGEDHTWDKKDAHLEGQEPQA